MRVVVRLAKNQTPFRCQCLPHSTRPRQNLIPIIPIIQNSSCPLVCFVAVLKISCGGGGFLDVYLIAEFFEPLNKMLGLLLAMT